METQFEGMPLADYGNKSLIVIPGFQRSGTSWVAQILEDVPGVLRSKSLKPEPRLFLDRTRGGEVRLDFGFSPDWRSPSVTHLLEKSTTYIEHAWLPKKILDFDPGALCVVMMRRPVDRAVSHYNFSRSNGLENLSIEEAFELDIDGFVRPTPEGLSSNPYDYLRKGRYWHYLEAWVQAWPEQQLVLMLSEQVFLNKSPGLLLVEHLKLSSQRKQLLQSRATNRNQSRTEFSHGFMKHLRRKYSFFFEESNAELERLGLDLTDWQ